MFAEAALKGIKKDTKFIQANLESVTTTFGIPQFNSPEFVPGLSLVDVLMNLGFEQSARLLGVRT